MKSHILILQKVETWESEHRSANDAEVYKLEENKQVSDKVKKIAIAAHGEEKSAEVRFHGEISLCSKIFAFIYLDLDFRCSSHTKQLTKHFAICHY